MSSHPSLLVALTILAEHFPNNLIPISQCKHTKLNRQNITSTSKEGLS